MSPYIVLKPPPLSRTTDSAQSPLPVSPDFVFFPEPRHGRKPSFLPICLARFRFFLWNPSIAGDRVKCGEHHGMRGYPSASVPRAGKIAKIVVPFPLSVG